LGYKGENEQTISETIKMFKKIGYPALKFRYITPYPGSKLYAEALTNGWFRVDPKDYERFDMKEPVMTTPDMTPEEVMKLCDEIYKVFLTPQYMLKQLVRIRSLRDVKYSVKGAAKVLGHVKDFAKDK